MPPVGELEDSVQSSRPNLYSVAGFNCTLHFGCAHSVFVTACGLSGTCYPYTEKIVDECSTDHIYLAALSHNIRNKKCLKNIFFKACPY